jgi:hypothetical protein
MTVYEQIVSYYPELENSKLFDQGTIAIQNDGDGDYIAKWEYDKPLPAGMKVGKN